MATGNRDAASLFIAQRLGESNGAIKPTTAYRQYKETGGKLRKQTFLDDFREIKTGKPERPTPKPSAVRGGLLSGVMRQKKVKALPEDDRATVKATSQNAIKKIVESGDPPRQGVLIVTDPLTKKLSIQASSSWKETEALPDGAEVKGNVELGQMQPENLQVLLDSLENLYAKLT